MRNLRILFLLSIIITGYSYSQFMTAVVSERLANRMKITAPGQHIQVLVLLKDQVDIETLDNQLYMIDASAELRAKTVITALMQKAQQTQGPMTAYLNEEKSAGKVRVFTPYWITNFFYIEAVPEVIQQISARNDVDMIDINSEMDYDKPVSVEPAVNNSASSEVGLRVINANKVWQLGFTGTGRLVMNDDTGVDGNHPALNYKWRGNNGSPWYHAWIDPPAGTTFPSDCDNHGTHTMGIMTGREGADTIGVAPGAQWIAAKTICAGNSTNNHMTAWQWALNPDSNVNTITDMPDAIGNSWYDPGVSDDCTSIYVNALNSMEAAGVAIVFSCGNSGPGTSTITKPKNINTHLANSFSVGNINGNSSFPYPINSTSSRGPGICGNTGKLRFKPEVSAPGTSVRSSIRNGQYSALTGTSMACPHIVGSVALLRQFKPNATGRQILEALYWTAQDLGTPGEDNIFGTGVIDVWAAFQYLNKTHCRQQNVIIMDNATNYDTIGVNTAGLITDVNITIGALTHSKTGDLEFSVTSPQGTEVILSSRRGGVGDNFINTVFNDSAANPISSGTAPFTGSFRPESPLSVLNGQNSFGNWIFRVNDNTASDTGRVMNYCITIYYNNLVGISGNSNTPLNFSLEQNYPNPFNPNTSIKYYIAKQSFVRLVIYDISGKEVAVLANESKLPGTYDAIFSSGHLASGVYFYSIEAGDFRDTKKMVLIK